MIPPTPLAVLATFQRVTGIRLRVISHNMESQAIDFVKAGFTLPELESVIRFTQQQIQAGKSGFSHLSLQFHVIFGKYGSGGEFETFQTRLAMSEKTIRLRPEPKPVTRQVRVDNGKIVNILDVAGEPDCEPIRQATVGALSDLRKSMGGQG